MMMYDITSCGPLPLNLEIQSNQQHLADTTSYPRLDSKTEKKVIPGKTEKILIKSVV